jgi:hypothetical protein
MQSPTEKLINTSDQTRMIDAVLEKFPAIERQDILQTNINDRSALGRTIADMEIVFKHDATITPDALVGLCFAFGHFLGEQGFTVVGTASNPERVVTDKTGLKGPSISVTLAAPKGSMRERDLRTLIGCDSPYLQ